MFRHCVRQRLQSKPVSNRKMHGFDATGVSPSGKAQGFDPCMRRFESCHPSHFSEIGFESRQNLNAVFPRDSVLISLGLISRSLLRMRNNIHINTPAACGGDDLLEYRG